MTPVLEGIDLRIAAIIGGVGRDVTHRTIANTGTAYNPTQTPTDVTVRAAMAQFKAHEIDNSLVQADDIKAYVAADAAIAKQDKIVDGGIEYHIISLRTVAPGAVGFLYIAQLRA